MGIKIAPTYAALGLGFLEGKLYEKTEKKYDSNIEKQLMNKWWKYLDDCFLIWEVQIDSSENLPSILQGLHQGAEFIGTAEESKEEITFLDIKIIIQDKKIITDLHQKPIDSQKYIQLKSCHLSHKKEIFSLAMCETTA